MNEITKTILEVQDVFKIYTSISNVKVTALRGITLEISEGTIMGIYGPSGAGKSTLIRILGLLELPSSGEIVYNGKNSQIKFSQIKEDDRRKIHLEEFGFLFQLPEDNLFYNLTAFDNILLPMKILGNLNSSQQKKRVTDLLQQLGILNRANHKPSQLSGGEAQRLGICVALANDPKIVFCDEPTGELDALNKINLLKVLKRLNEEAGKTFVIVSHDRRVTNFTDKQIFIENGALHSIYHRDVERDPEKGFMSDVSEIGEVDIPIQFLQSLSISKTALIEEKNNGVLMQNIPKHTNEKYQPSSDEKFEYIQVSENGRIILPVHMRKSAKILDKANIRIKNNAILIRSEKVTEESKQGVENK